MGPCKNYTTAVEYRLGITTMLYIQWLPTVVLMRRSCLLYLLDALPSTIYPLLYVQHLVQSVSFFGFGHVGSSGVPCGRGPGQSTREKKGWRKLWEDVHRGMDRVRGQKNRKRCAPNLNTQNTKHSTGSMTASCNVLSVLLTSLYYYC